MRRRVTTPEQAAELALAVFWHDDGDLPEWYTGLTPQQKVLATIEAEMSTACWRWSEADIERRIDALSRQRGIA